METIKIGKIYPIVNKTLKRKVILYNNENKILVLDDKKILNFQKKLFITKNQKKK